VAQASSLDASARGADRGIVRRAGVVAALGALAGLAVLLEAPLCPTASLFGLPCPGCGLTRATLALLQGQFAQALRLHPLVPLLAPIYFGVIVAAALAYIAGPGRRLPRLRVAGRWLTPGAWALLVLVFGVWLSRFFGAFGGPVPVRSLTAAPLRALFAPTDPPLTR
jgi:hypothetical protein